MGLLDRVMDMVFLPNTGSVVVRSSQGRFFLFFVRVLAQQRSYLVIHGPDCFETNDIG